MPNVPYGIGSNVTRGRMYNDLEAALQKKRMSPSGGTSAFALGVGKVMSVNPEEMTVTLRILIGENQEFQKAPVPLTFPGAGYRHFLGAIPSVGDYCIVGWRPQDSAGDGKTVGEKIPVVLSWIVPGVWSGQDWIPTQPFTPDELGFFPKDQSMVAGVFEKVRHKLRHMTEGSIVASSGTGSDLVLDEGVLLSSRRLNEIRLRDQDQSLVVRTLQQFHAMAGARIYGGMIQRDGIFLPTQMFSDGKEWDTLHQMDLSPTTGDLEPVHEEDLPESEYAPGNMTPSKIFQRSLSDQGLGDPWGPPVGNNIDPYTFLKDALLIDEQGALQFRESLDPTVYGGKKMYRVSVPREDEDYPANAIVLPEEQALTEYRIEVSHTSDGTLPVTEQTDGFDADRLPRSDPEEIDELGPSPNRPYIEMVLGSVVGNDPFNRDGRAQYGIPLRASIFDDDGSVNPQMLPAVGLPLKDHAATLFRVRPPTQEGGPDTFWSATKDGRVKVYLGGDQNTNSLDLAMRGGMHLAVGGQVQLNFANGFRINTKQGSQQNNNVGLGLGSESGGVHIYGGGDISTGSLAEQVAPAGSFSPASSPSVLVEGRNVVQIKGSQEVQLAGAFINANASQVHVSGLSNVFLDGGDQVGINTKELNFTVAGKTTQNYSGPKDQLPTNGPVREVKFTSLIPGLVVDKYEVKTGSREEIFDLGNHKTTIKVGDLTYETNLGKWKAKAGTNEMTLGSTDGLKANVTVGNISMDATTGSVTISGTTGATMKSIAGRAVVSGTSGVFLGGPGKVGNIVCSSDLDPLSGLPLATFGMGSPGHQIGIPVV